MKSFLDLAQTYAHYHQKPVTLYTHFVGVPLIVFSVMVLFSFLQLVVPGVFSLTSAEILTIAVLIYYILLNWRLGLSITPLFIILLWIAHWVGGDGPSQTSITVFLVCFILGWIIQLIGHLIEGNKPAFLTSLWQMVIAPLFLMAEVYFLSGKMQSLKENIYPESVSKK
ncbi:DUF962 domain-containing protein [Legionella sp. W05-934-2]|jgi:uncharacterized membrane protein YGL010W|uniref:Mpo1 family 2-hydroxy fatty acid dioxygenase n=1 Tax=Legionella sp. W05-934-2 TaxID=1198649 RepID=UPI003462CF5D